MILEHVINLFVSLLRVFIILLNILVNKKMSEK